MERENPACCFDWNLDLTCFRPENYSAVSAAAMFPMSPLPTPAPLTRRQFVRATGLAAAGAVAGPLIIPSRLLGADAPSSRIRVGQIGCGRIATAHDMPGVLKSGL